MCCLFGIIDYGSGLTVRQRTKILSALASSSEERGTDAAGIACNSGGRLCIRKRPVPAHKLELRLPKDAVTVMGHTRLTTQGNAKANYNNHPFLGKVGNSAFALAHNGVLRNDLDLRGSLHLPETNIKTDSYIAVQLLEQQNALNFDSLRYMAEKVEGSFTFTVLDDQNNWYLVKGDNPMCLCHFPESNLYLYASTEVILDRALWGLRRSLGQSEKIDTRCGDLLKIDSSGQISQSTFNAEQFWPRYTFWWPDWNAPTQPWNALEQEKLDNLKSMAAVLGYAPEKVEEWLAAGFTTEEIEDALAMAKYEEAY